MPFFERHRGFGRLSNADLCNGHRRCVAVRLHRQFRALQGRQRPSAPARVESGGSGASRVTWAAGWMILNLGCGEARAIGWLRTVTQWLLTRLARVTAFDRRRSLVVRRLQAPRALSEQALNCGVHHPAFYSDGEIGLAYATKPPHSLNCKL